MCLCLCQCIICYWNSQLLQHKWYFNTGAQKKNHSSICWKFHIFFFHILYFFFLSLTISENYWMGESMANIHILQNYWKVISCIMHKKFWFALSFSLFRFLFSSLVECSRVQLFGPGAKINWSIFTCSSSDVEQQNDNNILKRNFFLPRLLIFIDFFHMHTHIHPQLPTARWLYV